MVFPARIRATLRPAGIGMMFAVTSPGGNVATKLLAHRSVPQRELALGFVLDSVNVNPSKHLSFRSLATKRSLP